MTATRVDRDELRQEAVHTALYVSIVILGTLAALPEEAGSTSTSGVHGDGLLALVWGTALGLALAHWFAFRLAGRVSLGIRAAMDVGLAQLAGAALVAALCTVPILLFPDSNEVRRTAYAPALVIGVTGYLAARQGGRSRVGGAIVGLAELAAGIAVALVKNFLLGH